MSILKKISAIALLCVMVFGCSNGLLGNDEEDSAASPTRKNSGNSTPAAAPVISSVTGTFTIPVTAIPGNIMASRVASSGALALQPITLAGSVLVTVGNVTIEVPASSITRNSNSEFVVTFDTEITFEGVVVITCMSSLTVNSTPIEWAGYVMSNIEGGAENNINDVDGDGTVSESEATGEDLLTEATPTSFTVTSKPVFNSFSAVDPEEASFITTISANISQLDWGIVYLRVNDQYRPVNVSLSDGSTTINETVTLNPGNNEIQLFAINSMGYSESEIKTVNCGVTPVDGAENFLFTLTWDNSGDIDLHTWYFASAPTSSTPAVWHNYFGSKSQPNTDELQNLDVDNTSALGPEHFTLLGAPDGYYVIAINDYNRHDVDTNAFVSVQTNEGTKSFGPFNCAVSDAMANIATLNTSTAWFRVADIKVVNGVATILDPDTSFEPGTIGSSQPLSSLVFTK